MPSMPAHHCYKTGSVDNTDPGPYYPRLPGASGVPLLSTVDREPTTSVLTAANLGDVIRAGITGGGGTRLVL